jgi:hypothetical protein
MDVMSLSLADFVNTLVTFNTDMPHKFNRFSGGFNRIAHPFVSGYWYFLIFVPAAIFEGGEHLVSSWFHSTAESFTPPTKSLNKFDVPGMGGVASSFIAGQEISREFSVAFREYQTLPISTALRTWISVIDPHLGRSPLKHFAPYEYKGAAMAILANPTFTLDGNKPSLSKDDIDQVYYFDGVFPLSSGEDAFGSDISTNDGIQLNVSFTFDGGYYTKETTGLVDKAIRLLDDVWNPVGDSLSSGINDMSLLSFGPTVATKPIGGNG